MSPEVCTVIVTYNRVNMLQDAVMALKQQTFPMDIVVINNGSTDSTREYLNNQKGIKVIHQDNVGGAGGFFTGMKYACENGYKFVWIMDDDVIPATNSLEVLYKAYEFLSHKEEIGFLCSRIISDQGEIVNVPVIDKKANSTGYSDWGKYLAKGIIRVESATFVSVLIPCKHIKELGLPYREYFIWGDDTEYTKRLTRKLKGFMIAESVVVHRRIGGALDISTFTDPSRIRMYSRMLRNNAYNHRLYSSKTELLRWFAIYSKLGLSLMVKGKIFKSRMVFKGLWEGIRFKPTLEYPN